MNALKEQREKVMLSQAELAEKAGLAKEHVNKLENGRAVPWPRTVRKLAEALGCELSALASLRIKGGE